MERTPKRADRLYDVAEGTWWDIGCYLAPVVCSTCSDRPALYFRWTGRRWWKLCELCLVGHLTRNQVQLGSER